MEIQGVKVPKDILCYIGSFLLFNDDWNNYWKVFACSGTCEWVRPVRFQAVYKRRQNGTITVIKKVKWIACLTRGVFVLEKTKRRHPDLTIMDLIRLTDEDLSFNRGKDECYGGMKLLGNVNELPRQLRHDYPKPFQVDCDGGWPAVCRELSLIHKFLCVEIPLRYDQINAKHVLEHKRPRKRVKRLGFSE